MGAEDRVNEGEVIRDFDSISVGKLEPCAEEVSHHPQPLLYTRRGEEGKERGGGEGEEKRRRRNERGRQRGGEEIRAKMLGKVMESEKLPAS